MNIRCLLLLSILILSCNGQAQTRLPEENANTPEAITNGQPKIVKTQGMGPGANVRYGLQDKAGNIWFGSTGEGVYRYDGKSFTNFTVKDGLNNNHVWSICEDNAGYIWFGTADGICRYDGKNFTRTPITVNNGIYQLSYNPPRLNNTITVNSYGNPSEENAVWSILQDKTGKLWFGTTDGIYRYDGKSFTHFLHNDGVVNNTGLQINKVEFLLEDRAGNIWFGGRSTEGLFRFDGASLTSFTPNGKGWIRPVLEDNAGNIWFGTGGDYAFRYDGKSFTRFGENIFTGWVNSMTEDMAGNLWFATEKGGVAKYDGERFTVFTTKDGLSNNSVFSAGIDKTGTLWFGTRGMGLSSYDGKTFTDFSE